MPRRSLKPQLNQIRTWVRQGRTDAWIAHQLEVSVRDIGAFKREHELAPAEDVGERTTETGYGGELDEPDLRAEDDALVAAALDAEPEPEPEPEAEDEDEDEGGADDDEKPRRRRGRRGGRGRKRPRPAASRSREPSTTATRATVCGSIPAIQDDPIYAEFWAGHRPVTVTLEQDQIVIRRAGADAAADEDADALADDED